MTAGLDLENIAAELAELLGKVNGIAQAWDHYPDRIPQVPAALVGWGEVQYNRRFEVGAAQAEIPVLVVVGRANEAQSQRLLRRFQSHMPADPDATEGTFGSIAEALRSDPTIGSSCAASMMSTSSGVTAVSIAGVDYLAVEFFVTVHT